MKILSPFFLWIIACASGFGQDYSFNEIINKMPKFEIDTSVFSPVLLAQHHNDAARLAMRIIRDKIAIEDREVRIDEALQQSLFNALSAVRSSDVAAVDTIYRIYKVKTFADIELEHWLPIVYYPKPQVWTGKENEDTTTAVYLLKQKYNLSGDKLVFLDEQNLALVLKSPKPIDIKALEYLAEQAHGIRSIKHVLTPYGDGNDIKASLSKKGWELAYAVRFGNCVNQCQKAYTWRFVVAHNGEVDFLGGDGDTIPPWILSCANCGKRFPEVLKAN